MKETRPTAYRYRHRQRRDLLTTASPILLDPYWGSCRVLTRDLTQTKPVLIQLRKKATDLPGALPYESDGDVRWKIKIKP